VNAFYFLRRLLPLILLAGVAGGLTVEAQDLHSERESAANRHIHDAVFYWQKRLKLEDWNIAVLLSRRADLRPGTLGNIRWDSDEKKATIRVLDAADYLAADDSISFDAVLKDMEFTIVHELIHLELSPLPRSEASRSDEEYAINHLAAALLDPPHSLTDSPR
jgi:hypothetical protein